MEQQTGAIKQERFKSPFELSDMYSEQFDEDGHEEEFIDDIYSDYPNNAIFI